MSMENMTTSHCTADTTSTTTPQYLEDAQAACKPFSAWPEVMVCEDIMECLGLSQRHAAAILKDRKLSRPFPTDRRNMVVGKYALRDFLNGRTITDDSATSTLQQKS